MSDLRQRAVANGWLRENEELLLPRLAFPLPPGPLQNVHPFNLNARDRVLSDMLNGTARPASNPSCLISDAPDPEKVVGESDRYGLPIRTMMGMNSGLLRSDPYYDAAYQAHFYSTIYRDLYRPPRFSLSWFFAEQVRHGQRIYDSLSNRFGTGKRVLDVGCGMGGTLVAFKMLGWTTVGCDYGDTYAAHGRSMNLDIRTGGFETVSGEKPFDLVIVSHVLEHCVDPVGFSRSAASHLVDDGLCYVEVPGLLNLEKYYSGDLLQYLQNAHLWHFTAGTLTALLARAGLHVTDVDQTITCLARRGSVDPKAIATDGPRVLAELQRLESPTIA